MLSDRKIALRRANVVFASICFLCAAYMSLMQVFRYLANEDTSSITNKLFNQTPRDQYPTFSICFKGLDVYWRKEEMLFNTLGVTSSQYVATLKGYGQRYEFDETTHLYSKIPVHLNNATLIDVENVILDKNKVIIGAEFNAQQESYTRSFGKGRRGKKLTYNPFSVGYQTYHEICFTRKSIFEPNLKRAYDLVFLDSSLFRIGTNLNVEMRIIVHYPGQLIRNFEKPSFKSTLGSYIKDKVLEIKLSSFTKLSKRPDSNVKCNPDLEHDDLKFLQKVIEHLDCVPVYWSYTLESMKKFRFPIKTSTLCKTSEKLKNASEQIRYFKQVFGRYEPPCVEMTSLPIITREVDQLEQQFLVKFTYPVSFYQEIKNIREFTMETFWSTAGGYLGFFLGYSLLQVPELLQASASYFRNMRLSVIIGEFDCIFIIRSNYSIKYMYHIYIEYLSLYHYRTCCHKNIRTIFEFVWKEQTWLKLNDSNGRNQPF